MGRFWALLGNQQFLLLSQLRLVFTTTTYGLYFPQHWNPELCSLAWGWDLLPTRCLPDFYPPHMNVGLCVWRAASAVSQPLACRGHTVPSSPQFPVSTLPACLDEYSFFKSLVVRLQYSSIFLQFWVFFILKSVVILFMVVQGGKVYLPMPPS